MKKDGEAERDVERDQGREKDGERVCLSHGKCSLNSC